MIRVMEGDMMRVMQEDIRQGLDPGVLVGKWREMGASYFDCIHIALQELGKPDPELELEPEQSDSGGIFRQTKKLFKKKFNSDRQMNTNSGSSTYLFRVGELDTDWMFLSVCKVVLEQNLGRKGEREGDREYLFSKIGAEAKDFAWILIQAVQIKYNYVNSSRHLVTILSDWLRTTRDLKAEAGEFLDYFSSGFYSSSSSLIELVYFPLEYAFFPEFLNVVLLNLKTIEESITDSLQKQRLCDLCNELDFFKIYIVEVKGNFGSEIPFLTLQDATIDAFFARVSTVLLHVAFLSCDYWFTLDRVVAKSNLVRLVEADFRWEFDPANPEFLKFNLVFLKAVYGKLSLEYDRDRDTYPFPLENAFCRYLVNGRVDYDFENELRSLVKSVICTKLDNSREDVKSFFAEIDAVLVEVASLFAPSRNGTEIYPPPCPESRTKVCLLKIELFLKEELNDYTFLTLYGKHLSKNSELHKVLKRLRLSSQDLPDHQKQYGRQSLALVQDVVKEITSLYQSFYDNNITKSIVENSFRQLLLKIVIFKAESFLMELLKCCESSRAFEKDQVEFLLKQLKGFTLILTNQLMEEAKHVEIIFAQIEAFARRITFSSYSFLPSKITEEMLKKIILSFSELLVEVHHIKAKLKEISPQFPVFTIPKTHQLGFIDFLFRVLGELLKHDPKPIASVKHYIEEIQLHLKSFLMKVSDSDMDNPELKDLGNRVTDIAYKVDYVIDCIEVDAHWHYLFWLYDLLEEIKLVDKQASSIDTTSSDAKVQNVNNIIQVSGDSTPATNEVVVDLSDQEGIIIDRLTRGSSRRNIVSIVGMPGIGKTTLARKVYNSQQIKYHFHRLAWCTVSQVYEKRELLLEIMSDIHGLAGGIHHLSNADLEENLRKCLLKNKYLIVMDDVWDTGAWNDLQMSFPEDSNGSRILLTSRLCDVAMEIEPNSVPHNLRPFSNEECWKLLEKHIFQGEACPKELLLIGEEIAQQCKGLPLAVVAVAGLLKRTEKRQEWWKRIAESLSSQIINDPEAQCMKILELSYKHLPESLKACFLYLGAFLEDKDIPVSKLIRFWLAEGFIENTELMSLEDVAEDYLMDLINRSLVIISKRGSNGKVKACRLHDLIRDLCQSKAKEENFLQLVTRRDEPYASLPSSAYGFEFDFDPHLDPVTFEAHRLSILLRRNHFVDSRPSGLGTRSLIFFASEDSEPRCPYDISFICQNFKHLRVLDLECINMGISFPAEIGLLVQLRYLAVSGYVHNVPQSIANLWKLETFVVRGLRGTVVLPDTIWHMIRLRHLHVNNHVTFNLQDEDVGSSFQLHNLVSFSCPSLAYGEDTENILKRLPNLCKLRCIFLESWDSSKNCNQFPRLNFLTHLESLKIFYYGRALSPSEFILPLNLKKLTLSKFCLPWDHISAIGKLPNLEILKLASGAFEGQIWDMREEEFQELKYLKLDTLNIAQWNASCDHLPKLRRLLLQNCKGLEKIPYDFADITSLETVEVRWCGQSVEESAREIGDATGEIEVLISH
ncbi:hypothetical protein ACH5RR_023969 [Cinchona calisaya]|uniref:Uncharacterized protein n=1 Tax=Cinchona calisaya TaxID=153742 RepID=A0ABD2ZG12_9GENT